MTKPVAKRPALVVLGVIALLAVFFAQMAFSVHQESITWDEDDHIFAGYESWKHADFGLNPEHPPLVKLLATLPILNMPLNVPRLQGRDFKIEAFLDGKDFLFKNDADTILFRTRMMAASLAVLLALLVFLAAQEMFGTTAGFLALTLVAFEPNLLAHGARVTTDTGLTCFTFATMYAFYRYVKTPSMLRLAITGIAAGLALASKHTGILIFPMLLMLAASELFLPHTTRPATRSRLALRLAGALAAITVLSVVVLWAFYGFRYAARPDGLVLNPTLADYMQPLRPHELRILTAFAHYHILPESYLYGLTDVRQLADFMPSYIFGRVLAHGVWYYFPVAFSIKSTLGFLGLLLLAVFAIVARRLRCPREILFLTIPPVFHLLVAMSSGLNIGARHILPLYVFFAVLAAGAASNLIQQNRRWVYAVAALLFLHIASSAHAFPTYIPYANEAWGGSANTYKYLSDSNTDWAQQLKATSKYLRARGVKQCWFAYFAQGVVDYTYYGIPCKPLITADSRWMNEEMNVPAAIDGPVLISAGTLSGFEFGSDQFNPYRAFKVLEPVATIQHGIFVYDGRFDVPLAAALSLEQKAGNLLGAKQPDAALPLAQAAVAADPDCLHAQKTLGDVLRALHRPQEARSAYEKALVIANRLEPGIRQGYVSGLQARMKESNSSTE